jgi:DNA-binding NarL/FixJ family response regulator
MDPSPRPITVALVDDYDVVVVGVANILGQYPDRVVIAEIDTNRSLSDEVDVVLYDSFAQPESDRDEIKVLVDNPRARRVVVYTWNFHPDLIDQAKKLGVHGYLSKSLPASELVASDWPGRSKGLSDRESEVLALITQGKSNAEIAALCYLSINTVKSYVRSVYRKIDVESRTQAVLWGVEHGFKPDHRRIDHWRGGP